MLNLLELKHFKCFEHLKLPLANLTVLSGTNASGKSSVLQALALLHQTMREHEWSNRLALNGGVTQAGFVSDVVDQVWGRDRFEIGLSDDQVRCNWTFSGDRHDMSAKLVRIDLGGMRILVGDLLHTPPGFIDFTEIKPEGNEETLSELRWLLPEEARRFTVDHGVSAPEVLALGIRDLMYVTAEREGPREAYSLMDNANGRHGVGTRGEYAVSVLFHGMYERIPALTLASAPPTLARQVEARLDTFFPGCRIDVSQVRGANAVVLGVRTSENTGFLRPVHSGFGITQILPIVVAVLSARASLHDNPLILIENPEVHLHPSGQALMGQFLAEAAHAGVQIIAETHSDHVLNGVRRAVKSEKAQADEVAIHFFQDRFRNESQVLSPMLDPSGNIDVWPDGFFDQFDKDLDYFAGWGLQG